MSDSITGAVNPEEKTDNVFFTVGKELRDD
jgi:hypothetical protein